MQQLATDFKNLLGLDYPDCHEVDVEAWAMAQLQDDETVPRERQDAKITVFKDTMRLLVRFLPGRVFPERPPGLYEYLKPQRYMAIVFAENYRWASDIMRAMDVLVKCECGILW